MSENLACHGADRRMFRDCKAHFGPGYRDKWCPSCLSVYPDPAEEEPREDAAGEPAGASWEFIARWTDPEFGEVRIRTRDGELTLMGQSGQLADGHHLEILTRRVGSLGGFLNATKAATASVGAGSLLTIPFDQGGAVADRLCGLTASVARLRENDPDDFDVDGEVRAAIIDVAALLRIILGRSAS